MTKKNTDAFLSTQQIQSLQRRAIADELKKSIKGQLEIRIRNQSMKIALEIEKEMRGQIKDELRKHIQKVLPALLEKEKQRLSKSLRIDLEIY